MSESYQSPFPMTRDEVESALIEIEWKPWRTQDEEVCYTDGKNYIWVDYSVDKPIFTRYGVNYVSDVVNELALIHEDDWDDS